jgi:hypothetical protein
VVLFRKSWHDFESTIWSYRIHNNRYPPWGKGEACQVSIMVTKGYILEIKSNMVQQKCMEALNSKAVMSGNVAQSKKVKG